MRYRHQRYACDTGVTLVREGAARQARLVNVSATGARLEVEGRPPRESMVTLSYLHVRIPARVVWSTERQAGLRFLAPLAAADLAALRREGGRQGGSWGTSAHHGFRELS